MSSKRIMDIELLRAVAVMGVLFHHVQGMPFPGGWPRLSALSGSFQLWWGVDLFFAISGFVIGRSLIPQLRGCDNSRQFWATARDASFKLITALAKDQEAASIMKLPDWGVYNREFWPTLTHNRRIDGLAVTTAGESALKRDYGAYTLDDVTMAVSLDMFGPSIFVIASERLGGIDLSVGYTAYAMSETEVQWLTDRSIALLSSVR